MRDEQKQTPQDVCGEATFLPARLTAPGSLRMPRPQSLLIGKREDPGDEGEMLVPDLSLTANFKMAAEEDT